MPLHCRRCRARFDLESDLDAHITAIDETFGRCTLSKQEPLEGVTDRQWNKLMERRTFNAAHTVADKWRVIYQMLVESTQCLGAA